MIAVIGDVNPFLVTDIFFSYNEDRKSGLIDDKGRLIGDIEKSQVMKVVHDFSENGLPLDGKETVVKAKNLAERRKQIGAAACVNVGAREI